MMLAAVCLVFAAVFAAIFAIGCLMARWVGDFFFFDDEEGETDE